jgi:hypothetical protein
MAAAAMGGKPSSLWDKEIDDLIVVGPQLPASARLAVCAVLESLFAEGVLDARRSRAATALRQILSAPQSLDRAA